MSGERGDALRFICISICILLVINIKLYNAISFGLRAGTKAVKGSNADIICNIGEPYWKVNIYKYKYDTSDTKEHVSLCGKTLCQSFPGYNFTLTARSITITIFQLQRNRDEMLWECADAYSGHTAEFQLTVYTEPLGVTFSTTNSCDLAQRSCSFTCETTSCTYPAPTFQWYYTVTGGTYQQFDLQNIAKSTADRTDNCTDSERIYSGTINIPKYTTFHGNAAITINLQCGIQFDTLVNELKSQPSDTVRFAVAVKQVQILPDPGATISTIEGQIKSVSCITSGSRPAATVTWSLEKTGQTRQLGTGNDRYFTEGNDLTVTNSTLMLNTTRVYQGWKISCQATSFGTKKVKASNPKELNILYPTSIKKFIGGKVGESQSPGSVTVNEYENVTGECQVDSNPESSIEISHRGLAIAKADKVNDLAFQVLNPTCLDNGEIICKGWNDIADFTAAVKGIHLHVRCSPRLQFDTDSIVVARQGTSAVMSLSILAYPAPTLSLWQRLVNDKWEDVRNTTSFVLTSSSLQYNLTVMSVTRQLYGSYNLTLENGVGSPLIFTFKLQNKGKPDVPTDIAVLVVSSTAILVSWTAGYDGDVQQSFYIQYKASDTQDWTTKKVADHKSDERLSIGLDGLKPATDYMLRIFAANAEGNSSLSETLTFRMKIKVDDGLKDNINISAVALGVAACVLALVVFGLLLFIFRRNSRLQACINKNNEKATNQESSSKIGNAVVNAANVDNTRSSSSVHEYDELNTETEDQTDEKQIKPVPGADTVSPTQSHVNKQGSSSNAYDDLNTETEAVHTYTALQADTVSPTQSHVKKQDSQKAMYYNVSDTKRPLKNQGSSRDAPDAPSTSSGQAIVYSNLKLADE